jgi:bifunctional DNA-binding transcriptional regulator/antitoxin component of YhaV-PrlF toxin-antitoxin module
MGFLTKVQLISRKVGQQYYVNVPSAIAQAMEFSKGEPVEWIVADKAHLILARKEVPPNPVEPQRETEVSAARSADEGSPGEARRG